MHSTTWVWWQSTKWVLYFYSLFFLLFIFTKGDHFCLSIFIVHLTLTRCLNFVSLFALLLPLAPSLFILSYILTVSLTCHASLAHIYSSLLHNLNILFWKLFKSQSKSKFFWHFFKISKYYATSSLNYGQNKTTRFSLWLNLCLKCSQNGYSLNTTHWPQAVSASRNKERKRERKREREWESERESEWNKHSGQLYLLIILPFRL